MLHGIIYKQEEVENAENAVRMLGGSILQISPGVFSFGLYMLTSRKFIRIHLTISHYNISKTKYSFKL